MGCVYNRGTRAKPNFWIKWVGRDGRPKYEKIGPDRALALAVVKKKEATAVARRHGIETDQFPEMPTFAAAAQKWIERRSTLGKDGLPMRRSWKDDEARLNGYLLSRLGAFYLDEIQDLHIRKLIDALRPKLAPQSIRNCLAIVSRIFNEQPKAMRLTNPVAQLDRADREAIGPGWDPRKTPYLRSDQDVRQAYLAFSPLAPNAPWRALFAVGLFAGLRPGEIRGLQWQDVDFDRGLIQVRRSATGALKDDESRVVPLSGALRSVLLEWREIAPKTDLCFPSIGHRGRFVKEHALGRELRAALDAAKLPTMTWYQCTRHTFASRWIQAGGSLAKLAEILGHSTTEVTLRYAHLSPGNFTEQERQLVDVQLQDATVLPLARKRPA